MSTLRITLLGALVCALPAAVGWSQIIGFKPPENPPRFLFVVEKSEATSALDLSQTMFDLVYRGANGHLPEGGVFEIWLFGEETIFRGFPPQMLTPGNRLPLASRASAYVRVTESGGPANVGKLVEHVRGASELGMELTIILVTAPDTRLEGTVRDAEINGMLDANVEAQRAAGRPFITSIRVQDGVPAASTVSDSPFTMTMPAMPPSRLAPEERERRITEARQARMEREKPTPPPETNVVTQPPPRRQPDIPDDQREGAIILKGTPRVTAPPVETVTVTAKPAVDENPPKAVTAPVETPPPVTGASSPAGTVPASNQIPPSSTPEVSTSNSAAPATTSAPVVTSQAGNATIPAAGSVSPPPTNTLPAPAVVVPARTWLTAGGLFAAGLAFFVVAALLVWVLMRRARAAAGPSYITRSIEQHRD